MLGLVTQGQILVGITYRTNNISSLEEKNIKLFIEHAEKDLDIKNIFGPKGEKVFREFESLKLKNFNSFFVSFKIPKM